MSVDLTPPGDELNQLCPDLATWPQSGSYGLEDLGPGARIVEIIKPFLHHLLAAGRAAKTRRRHRDHLWMLGGEVIRRRQEEPDRPLDPDSISALLLEEDGGPLIWPRISETQQDAFDATCRKFHRYLRANSP